jgi:hypothetical protein
VNGDSGKVHADSGVMNSDSSHGAELWHFKPEIAVTINQNQRSRSARMGVNDEPEYALGYIIHGDHIVSGENNANVLFF